MVGYGRSEAGGHLGLLTGCSRTSFVITSCCTAFSSGAEQKSFAYKSRLFCLAVGAFGWFGGRLEKGSKGDVLTVEPR